MQKLAFLQPPDIDKLHGRGSSIELGTSLVRSRSPGTLSNLSVDDDGRLQPERKPIIIQTAKNKFWVKNKGVILVLLAQIFNCLMNVTITVLEIEGNNGKGFHPLQGM
jgi:hypothetical protein